MEYKKIKVVVETAERSFRGYLHKPVSQGDEMRFSDFLNSYTNRFLCLTDVQINERTQGYRAGDPHAFVAIAVTAITYLAPLDGE